MGWRRLQATLASVLGCAGGGSLVESGHGAVLRCVRSGGSPFSCCLCRRPGGLRLQAPVMVSPGGVPWVRGNLGWSGRPSSNGVHGRRCPGQRRMMMDGAELRRIGDELIIIIIKQTIQSSSVGRWSESRISYIYMHAWNHKKGGGLCFSGKGGGWAWAIMHACGYDRCMQCMGAKQSVRGRRHSKNQAACD